MAQLCCCFLIQIKCCQCADKTKADFDVIAKIRERLAVGKQAAQRFDGQRFNLRKLNEPQVREQYQIEIANSTDY